MTLPGTGARRAVWVAPKGPFCVNPASLEDVSFDILHACRDALKPVEPNPLSQNHSETDQCPDKVIIFENVKTCRMTLRAKPKQFLALTQQGETYASKPVRR